MASDKEIIQMLRVLDSTCKPESIEWVSQTAADRLEKAISGHMRCLNRLEKWCAMYPSDGLEPVKSAKWIDKTMTIQCSACGNEFDDEVTCTDVDGWPWEYCPKCGAKMEVSNA